MLYDSFNFTTGLMLVPAVLLGIEFGRRRAAGRTGWTFTFLPLWAYYAFQAVTAAAVYTFAETGRVAVLTPTSQAVMVMIVAAGIMTTTLAVYLSLELKAAKDRIADLTAAAPAR